MIRSRAPPKRETRRGRRASTLASSSPIAARFAAASSTARREASGTNTNGTPQLIACTGLPARRADTGTDKAAAARSGSRTGSLNTGGLCVIHANDRSPPFHVSDTGVGPTPRPNTTPPRSGPSTPVRASAKVVPIVGCPAIGSSSPGVKILTRMSVSVRSGGSTKVVSEKFISFAIARMVSVDRPRPSRKTASWLPPKRWSVKTS